MPKKIKINWWDILAGNTFADGINYNGQVILPTNMTTQPQPQAQARPQVRPQVRPPTPIKYQPKKLSELGFNQLGQSFSETPSLQEILENIHKSSLQTPAATSPGVSPTTGFMSAPDFLNKDFTADDIPAAPEAKWRTRRKEQINQRIEDIGPGRNRQEQENIARLKQKLTKLDGLAKN
jgi:hypothetical protein